MIEWQPARGSLIDVLDRILDKGIVIDAWVRISLVGIDLLTVAARVVLVSVQVRDSHPPLEEFLENLLFRKAKPGPPDDGGDDDDPDGAAGVPVLVN